MKKIIRKLATAILAGTLAFSMIPATVQAAGWKQNKNGYWWQENDYSYPRNQWKTIYGKQYHFNSGGYMDTGWTKVDGRWYYLGARNDGAKKTYWQKVYGKYYWLGSNGVMRTGWQQVYGKYYWLGGSNDGAMKTGWVRLNGKYYWLGNNGDMKSGWQTIYKKKYYLGGANDGAMKTGWQKIDGYWYYFGGADDGSLKTNTWIGNYYVDANGRWTKTRNQKVELESYLNDFNKMVSAINGELQRQTGDYEKYALGTDIECGKYYNSSAVDYLLMSSSKYSICGVYMGQSAAESKNVLTKRGWKSEKSQIQNEYTYTKGDMEIRITTGKYSHIIFARHYYDSNGDIMPEGPQSLEINENQPIVETAIPNENQQETVIVEDSVEKTENVEENEQEQEVISDMKQNEENSVENEQSSDETQSAETQKTEEQVEE